MVVDPPSSSFGDSNAQPPTPTRTPRSTVFPSPVLETPKQDQRRLDESSGWTPRFAEEYSVFNSTPGNLRGSRTPFFDFGSSTPYVGDGTQSRGLSTEEIGLGASAHVNELTPKPLPAVEPSKILRSTPIPLTSPIFDPSDAVSHIPGSAERLAKKARRGTVVAETPGQTATPPPSARKGERKLAPKLDSAAMQNEQEYSQQGHFMGSGQDQTMGGFVTTQGDMFSYPLSAPATAAPYGSQRSFWDADPNLASMDIDFSAHSAGVFQPPTPLQGSGPEDWARASQILQSQGGLVGHGDASVDGHAAVSLGSQPDMSMLVTSSADHTMFAGSYPTPVDDPFGMTDVGGAVNPGLLFSRPQSANMDTASFSQPLAVSDQNLTTAPVSGQMTGRVPSMKIAGRAELRRSSSAKDATPRKPALASSPIKEAGRPGLSRSFSENKGKKTGVARPSLPTLAPRPRAQLVSNAGVNANKPIVSQPNRPNGRSSPVKSMHHHHRLSSLTSIPEAASSPEMRTQATFMIDANGRARVETTVVVVDEPARSPSKRHSSYSMKSRQQWNSSDDEDSSSSDDEPIIIPSRNASFALPDPRKPTTIHPFHNSQRSVSEHSTTSYASFQGGGSQDAGDSDGETVVNEATPTRKASGDALSELRKLREARQKQASANPKRYISSSHYPGHPSTSPTTLSESSLPTPTAETRVRGVRCVCNRTEAGRNDLVIQCESCEMYVHGQCVSITQRTIPSIYICAFCSNTPNMRGGGRHRENGRTASAGGNHPPGSRSSPLAHKTLKSLR
ncbi:hypothetical protein B0J18DRAFT_444793 [Chaetomium sp. MPI-SDFR-AT-0129]|nr:hypothetical protein B0J18DRAFT_444793 [Chaetomium sp. MPI-SDFR-AT-0129]